MANVRITVTNKYLPAAGAVYIHRNVDISDFDEIDYCAEESCGRYLNAYRDQLFAVNPELDWETIAAACEYLIEEDEYDTQF